MKNISVYQEPVETRYTSNSTGATLLILLSALIVLIVPFVIGFSMGQFWQLTTTIAARPAVTYTGRMVLRVETSDGGALAYVNSANVMNAVEAMDLQQPSPISSSVQPMYPSVGLYADDHDGDGNVDAFKFTFQIPINYSLHGITKVCVLPEFDYVHDTTAIYIKMTGAPLVCVSAPAGDGSSRTEAAVFDGDLNLHTTVFPVSSSYTRYDRVYSDSLFPLLSPHDLMDLIPLVELYARRNFTLEAIPRVATFTSYDGLGVSKTNVNTTATLGGVFSFDCTIRVGSQLLRYVPSWQENLKMGWVQYFCIAYVIYWVMSHVRCLLVKRGTINTIAIWESRASTN